MCALAYVCGGGGGGVCAKKIVHHGTPDTMRVLIANKLFRTQHDDCTHMIPYATRSWGTMIAHALLQQCVIIAHCCNNV